MDLVNHYANKMALADETVDVNMLNSHLSYIFPADKQPVAESFKKMFDRVSSGEPAVVIDKSLFREDGSASWEPFTQNIGQNYISDRVLSDIRRIEAEFDSKVGIPNAANAEKKERLIAAEVESNDTTTSILSDLWLENLQLGVKQTNDMFGLSISVEKRYADQEGGEEDGDGSEDERTRLVKLG